MCPDLPPRRLVKARSAFPSVSRARRRKVTAPSRDASMGSVALAAPSTSSCGGACSVTTTWAPLPEPATLLATPRLTSKVSPGATIGGTFGVRTKSPRTRLFASAAPTASSFTATAITRSVPLKYSGTVNV